MLVEAGGARPRAVARSTVAADRDEDDLSTELRAQVLRELATVHDRRSSKDCNLSGMAYRGERGDVPRKAVQNDVLDEIVHQFADSYAFVRELVQNAIDAGATRVRLVVEAHDGVVHVSVEDDGAGMTLEIIEGPLLTAFSSGKEGAAGEGKIGKYGVGFLSVFALEPERVVVTTSTETVAHDVVILPDRSYTIEERPVRRRGTTVTLRLSSTAPGGAAFSDATPDHAARVEAAARRWCPHVRVPLLLSVDGGPERSLATPLSIVSAVSVTGERDGIRAVVAPRPSGCSGPAAFLHSGLLLHATDLEPPAIPFVAFKVESARFQHTISRDGVRADKAYAQALDLAKELAEGALCDALLPALAALADDDASTPEAFTRGAEVVVAAIELLPHRKIDVPLAIPTPDGRRSLPFKQIATTRSLFTATSRTFVAELLALSGAIVLRDDGRGLVRSAIARARSTDEVTALSRSDGHALLARVEEALRFAGVDVDRASLVVAHGRAPRRATWMLDGEVTTRSGFSGWILPDDGREPRIGKEVVLVASAPAIAKALSAVDARAAAALVARLVLAEARLSNQSSSERLLAWAGRREDGAAPSAEEVGA